MTANANRASSQAAGSGDADGRNGEQKKNLWTSMLESVSSGRRLPEKNLLVLGGTPELQRDFLDSLSSSEARRNYDRQKVPPIANNFALGYTYYDVLDADQDDTLARVSTYLLSQPSAEFASLVAPLLTAETVPNTALIILLDWHQPHLWLRQIWKWIQVIEEVMGQIGAETRQEMEDTMTAWKVRGRGGGATNLDGTPATSATGGNEDGSLPLGQGEWSEPLGLPLCVVCQNAQQMEYLEKQNGWKEPDFDTVLQYLRTVLLRHGGSLIYTSQNAPSQLPILIHSTLGITSLLKRQPIKHNVIDRDKIVVPPNWDSWGKIRVLGGTFDAEAISNSWAEDIKIPLGSTPLSLEDLEKVKANDDAGGTDAIPQEDSAIAQYENWCREPTAGGLPAAMTDAVDDGHELRVESEAPQDFLAKQHKLLEVFKARAAEQAATEAQQPSQLATGRQDKEGAVSDHIGPVQFNMGGIQVDADDMLQRLKDRNIPAEPMSPEPETPATSMAKDFDNEQLQSFFTGLMNRNAD